MGIQLIQQSIPYILTNITLRRSNLLRCFIHLFKKTGVPYGTPVAYASNRSAAFSGGNPHAQGVQLDESTGVGLIVCTTIIIKGRDGLVEQCVFRVA